MVRSGNFIKANLTSPYLNLNFGNEQLVDFQASGWSGLTWSPYSGSGQNRLQVIQVRFRRKSSELYSQFYWEGELTFVSVPCALKVNSSLVCPMICCNPIRLLPVFGRNLAVLGSERLETPFAHRDIVVVRLTVVGYLQLRNEGNFSNHKMDGKASLLVWYCLMWH